MTEAAEPTAAPESLRSRASRGAIASVVGQGASQGLRMAGNLVLARLLFPEAFGLMALVNMLLLGLQVLSELGLQPAIVRHPRGDERTFLDTAWTIGVVRGVVLALGGVALAYPMAALYREPALAAIVPVATLSALFAGLTSTKVATQTRHLQPAPVVAVEVGSQAIALVVMVVLALEWKSVWVLVLGGLVAGLLRMVLSHVAIPGPLNRPRWERSTRADLLAFGKWLFVSSIFTFVAMRVDVVLLGRLLPVETLGIYSIGMMLAQVVRDVLQQITRFVIIPALSASHRAGSDVMAANLTRVRGAATPAALFAILAATFLAPPFFVFLYDDRYHAASWIAQLSMLGVWFAFLAELSGSALLAAGDSRAWAAINGVRAVAMALACVAGFALGGLPTLMLGVAVASLIAYGMSARALAQHGLRTLRTDLPHTVFGLVVGVAGALAPRFDGTTDSKQVALRSGVVAVVILVPYGIWVVRRLLRVRG